MLRKQQVYTRVAGATAVAVACSFMSLAVGAEQYPSKAIEIMNPYPAGGTTDGLTRALAPGMSQRLGQPVVVVNKAGAAGMVGTEIVARRSPDGYSLIFMPALTLSVLPVTNKAGYTPDALVPICQTFSNAMAVIAPAGSPFNSVADLVKAARAAPGKLNYGHQGLASIPHLALVEFSEAADIKMQDVPYNGEPQVLVDLMGGRLDVAAVVLGGVAGRDVKVLGIFADERHPALPKVPTVKEQGYDVTPASFGGLFAPKGTPADVVAKLSDACGGAARDELYARAAKTAFQPTVYFADAKVFAQRLQKDIDDKKRLLSRIKIVH